LEGRSELSRGQIIPPKPSFLTDGLYSAKRWSKFADFRNTQPNCLVQTRFAGRAELNPLFWLKNFARSARLVGGNGRKLKPVDFEAKTALF